MKEYEVVLVDKKVSQFDEFSTAIFWNKANVLTDFCSPWNSQPFSKIEFRAVWDLENLFFDFRVFDTDIHIDQKDDSFDSIGNSDRVELFFRTDDSLNPYYCLEIDTAARIMDFRAYPHKNFDLEWKWPKTDLSIYASKNETSFSVSGKISVQSLNELNLIQNDTIETGVFRAKFIENEKQMYDPTWISWVDPNTVMPNFHIASSFGKFILLR